MIKKTTNLLQKVFLALCLLASVGTVWAEERAVGTQADLVSALEEGGEVRLTADINLDITAAIEFKAATSFDLDGHTLLVPADVETRMFAIKTDIEVTLKNGTLKSNSGVLCTNGKITLENLTVISSQSALLVYDKSQVTLDAQSELTSSDYYTVVIWGDNDMNPEFDVRGKILNTSAAYDEYSAITGNGSDPSTPLLNIYEGAEVSSANCSAIYWPNGGELTVEGGMISGLTGIYAKSGTVKIAGGTIQGRGAKTAFEHSNNGFHSTGDALVVETCSYPNGICVPSVTGGTFLSTDAEAIATYATPGCPEATMFVSGGHFSSILPQEMCAEGFTIPASRGDDGLYSISDEITLSDDAVWSSPTSDFTIGKATYTRTTGMGSAHYGTLCLPFSINGEVSGVKFYQAVKVEDDVLTIDEIEPSATQPIDAGAPLIFWRASTSDPLTITSEQATVTHSATPEAANNLVGTYTATTITDGLSDIYFLSGDRFHQADQSVTIPAYRAYIHFSSSPAPHRGSSIGIAVADSEAALETLQQDAPADAVYDLQGRPQQGLVPGYNCLKMRDGRTIKVFLND